MMNHSLFHATSKRFRLDADEVVSANLTTVNDPGTLRLWESLV
jgi:hypothetical protein